MKGVDIEDENMEQEHRAFLGQRLILHGAKDEGSFEAHASYLRDAFDRGTKVTQLAEAKLGLEGFSTRQEDAKIYRLRRKGHRYKATNRRAMGWQHHGTIEAGLPWSHRSLALMEGERQS
ncbi:hypothetical protein BHE74_00004267 [Ensete ventricosum]|nr:hypothetical protein GW17_00019652 [Ensete ventricosum]RWW86929.1 hypothetical protein BHE74_00004267 [Ensete ventricosum]